MNEVVHQPDYLIMEAMLVEEQLKMQIQTLTKYRRKISNLLEEKQLNTIQRQNMEHLLKLSRGDFVGEK